MSMSPEESLQRSVTPEGAGDTPKQSIRSEASTSSNQAALSLTVGGAGLESQNYTLDFFQWSVSFSSFFYTKF